MQRPVGQRPKGKQAMPATAIEVIEVNSLFDFEKLIHDISDFESKVEIVKHPKAGYRLSFLSETNSTGSERLAKYFLTLLGVEFEMNHVSPSITMVKILSGEYAGVYDIEYDYTQGKLNLFQELG